MLKCSIFVKTKKYMITYIELWKSKQEWLLLSKEERGVYLDALGPGLDVATGGELQTP